MAYDGTWTTTPNAPRIRQPSPGMYGTSSATTTTPSATSMYSTANSPVSGGIGGGVFDSALPSGGSLSIGDMQFQQGNVVPLEQTKLTTASQDYANQLGLIGTGLQTQAQRDVANTNIQPAMTKLGLQSTQYFPYLQSLIASGGLGGANNGLSSQLTASVLAASNPAREQAALNAADSNASRAASTAQQLGLRQVAGSGWSPASPVGAALTAASQAAKAAGAEEAKRKIRDDYANQRVTSLASAINLHNNSMSPIYQLLGGLMS